LGQYRDYTTHTKIREEQMLNRQSANKGGRKGMSDNGRMGVPK